MPWIYLAVAILAEVAASTALRTAEGFTRPLPSLLVVAGYAAAFYFLSLTLEAIPLGVSYAIWSGVGISLISLAGWIFYRQALSPMELLGVFLIGLGVVILKVGGDGA